MSQQRALQRGLAGRPLAWRRVEDFTPTWSNRGSGAARSGAFYRPNLPPGFLALGHYGQDNYQLPDGRMIVVRPIAADSVAPPVDYTEVWADHGSRAHEDGSFWLPVAPDGYVALGLVSQEGYKKPELDEVVCVRKDLVLPAEVGRLLWNDEGSGPKGEGAKRPFSAWRIAPTGDGIDAGTFVGVASRAGPPTSTALYRLEGSKLAPAQPSPEQLAAWIGGADAYSLRSYNYSDRVLGVSAQNAQADIFEGKRAFERFKVVAGLAGDETISLEAFESPGHYLAVDSSNQLHLQSVEDGSEWKQRASFRVHTGLAESGAFSFESLQTPGSFLRHRDFRVYLDPYEATPLFRADATFHLEEAEVLPDSLLVPMYLKGIYVDRPLQAAGPTADFTYLPWNDGRRDHNPDYAPLGEHIELPPLQNANGELQAGIHLHWTLPPALCRPVTTDKGNVQPYIPVKWQIRQREGGAYSRTLWSDYMHPASTPINDEHVAMPIPEHDAGRKEPPYRYMGVATESEAPPRFEERMRHLYREIDENGIPHEPKLTSLGYGDPTFSSYYPNGREILGHYVDKEHLDGDGDQANSKWLVYAKLYDPADRTTPLFELMDDTGLSLESLLSELGWATKTTDLKRIYLVGAVKLGRGSAQHDPVSDSSLEFAIGNTGSEALSAHLGDRLAAEYGDAGKIEEQLEAVLMGNKVHGHAADLSLKFLEARHAQGFQKHPGGTRWRLSGKLQESAALHDSLAKLNQCQEEVEQKQHELMSARRELFGDWYKYMLAKYPPPASLEQFEQTSYPTVGASAAWLEARKNHIEALQRGLEDKGRKLAAKKTALEGQLKGGVALSGEPADKFYSPTDPVVLISGLPEVHAAAGLKPKRVDIPPGDDPAASVWSAAAEAWGQKIVTTDDGWMPFIMEWQAEFLPLVDGSAKGVPKQRFTLHEHHVDADPKDVSGVPDTKPVYMQGRTFLSPGAKQRLEHSLSDFLSIYLPESSGTEVLPDRVKKYIQNSQTPSDTNDAVLTACRAHEALQDEKTLLSQSLGGFNDSLIQRERHLQPDMSDPLGSPKEREFSKEIGHLVGDEARLAPNPSQPFLPVRAGSFRITALRLIDAWGRCEDLLRDRQIEPVCAEPLRPFPFKPGWAGLRPRSVQPLRLHTDWLTADPTDGDDLTLDEDPLASPVVGWVMANHMERSLMCFDGGGAALGAYDREADFATAPGRPAGKTEAAPAMNHFMEHAAGNPAWVQDFLDATDDALAQIAPQEHLQHAGMAILAGRPLAVVRARLSFELMGLPVQNQSWALFDEQLKALQKGETAYRTRWQEMRLPVRLGSYQRLNDGLVGFWLENTHGDHVGPFHSMASSAHSSEILGHEDSSALIWLPLAGDSVTVTMVIDPRGSVHAATGMLPMKELKLRLRDFQQPLQRISSWFLQAPLLQPAAPEDQDESKRVFFAAPPKEQGLEWRWVEAGADLNAEGADKGAWKEYRNFHPMRTKAHLEAPSELREGWLLLEHDLPKEDAKEEEASSAPPTVPDVVGMSKKEEEASSASPTVPDVVGMSKKEAVSLIRKAGYKARVEYEETDDKAKHHKVVSSDPAAGTPLASEGIVRLTVGDPGTALESLEGIGPKFRKKLVAADVSSLIALTKNPAVGDSIKGISAERTGRWAKMALWTLAFPAEIHGNAAELLVVGLGLASPEEGQEFFQGKSKEAIKASLRGAEDQVTIPTGYLDENIDRLVDLIASM